MGLRGNDLEKHTSVANRKYKMAKKALILKVPTPIIYTSKGMVAQTSTVDFVGILKGGKFLAFDAKETINSTSFPLKNIHDHQYNYLTIISELGGIAFFLIHFKKVYPNEAFKTPMTLIDKYWNGAQGRQSIPIAEFKKTWLVPVDNYLKL